MREPTTEMFLREVAAHEMKVPLDSGLYRHLRFRNPASGNLWFDLVTWPQFLVISGDMGTWAFSRVEDMFTFFRPHDGELRINASYWSEKLQNGVSGGYLNAKRFDREAFDELLYAQLCDYYDFDGEDLAELREAVEGELSGCSDGEVFGILGQFSHRFDDGRTFMFDMCEVPDGQVYAYQFLWCLYAIVWGIREWDALAKARGE